MVEAPRVATLHDTVKESGRVPPHPSAVFHAYASADTPWVSRTLYHCTPMKWGKVSSNSVPHDTTQTCSLGLDDRYLINSGGGYHLGAPKFRSDLPSTFPSSILHFSLIAPSGLQLCQPFDHFAKPHRTSIDRKGPITSGFQPLIFYR
jgi:hypothetical protein